MATYLGKDGFVKIGANLVGELRGFSIEESAETIDDTVAGDTSRSFKITYKNWTGTVDCLYDMDDTGQDAAAIGSEVTVKFYTEPGTSYGTPDSGDEEITGTAVIIGKTVNNAYDGLVEASFSLQGVGNLTYGTAS